MANESHWAEDIARWRDGSAPQRLTAGDAAEFDMTDFALGCEAAQPSLQARHWPDLPVKRPPDSES